MYIRKVIVFIILLSYLNTVHAYNNTVKINSFKSSNTYMPDYTKEEEEWLEAHPNINIATTLSAKYDSKGSNIHTDLLILLNKYGGTNLIAIKFSSWEEAFAKAKEDKLVFGILNLSWTKERSVKYFNYTKSYNFGPLYLITKEADTTIQSLKDLEHKTIYTLKKSSSNKTIEKDSKNVNVLHYSNERTMYENLSKNKDVSALVSYKKNYQDLQKYRLKVAKIIYNKYGNKHLGINKNYPLLHSIINKIFKIIPKEELSNLRDKIYQKDILKASQKEINLGLTFQERKWISQNTVSIGVEDWSPIVFMNTSLKIDGISGDYMKLIIKRTGLNVTYVDDTWDMILNDFKNKKIDILPASYYTEKRSHYGLYSKPYFKMKDYIYVKKTNNTIFSMKDLEGKTLIMQLGFGSIDKIQKKFPKINIITTKSLHEAINLVLNSKADALFNGQIVVEKKINDEFILGLKGISQASFESPSLHVFSNINKPILASIIQKALNTITIEKKVEISNKWLQAINNDISTATQINKNLNNSKNNQEFSLLNILTLGELLFSIFVLGVLLIFIYSTYSKSKILNININKFILFIVAFELSVIFFLIYQIFSLDRVENELALVYKHKTDIVQVMQKLRQSSDDLTKSVRSYAVTKEVKFKNQYFDILDIRNGSKIRPKHYNLIYWDLNKERREQKHKGIHKQSIKSIINKLPFNAFQKDLLHLSEFNSNNLVNLEKDAFKAMENDNQKLAIKLLFSKQYYKEKEKIMLPLDDMVISMYQGMNAQIELLNYRIKNEFIYIIIVGIFFILGNFVIYLMIMKKITQPLEYLSRIIKKFKMNDADIKKRIFYTDEIGETIQEFFHMKDSIEKQRKDLHQTHKHIKDSIAYSSLIQDAIIPDKELFAKYFKEYFVIWKPKDIIGGDIYLFNEITEDECIFMIIDCTGHGVPGAFVTMLVKALEREIFSSISNDTNDINTSIILQKFNKEMKSILKQENRDSISNAGFDGGIIYYNKKEKIIKFSGANSELFIMKDNELKMIKGDRHSIGYRTSDADYKFTEHIIDTQDNMDFYITTDGFIDQNGGEKGFPFGKRKFKSIIQKFHTQEFVEQEKIFLDTLSEYQGDEETNDDITMIAFKI